MTLANINYLEYMMREHIILHPDDISSRMSQYTIIVSARCTFESSGCLDEKVQVDLKHFYESLKADWPSNDWGLEDSKFYGKDK